MNLNSKIIVISLLLGAVSCKKDVKDPDPAPLPAVSTGTVKIEIENVVDNSSLVYGQNYLNPKGDTFTVSKFNYYISNIVLVKNDGSLFYEPASYHLVKHSVSATKLITISSVTGGSYKGVRLMIGVDSTANASGPRTGDLEMVAASDMYWTWNSGYIALKLEGKSPKSGESMKNIEYHLGGYGGANKAQRSIEINFGTAVAEISSGTSPVLHLKANVNELLKSPTMIDFSFQHTCVSPGPNVKQYADNYADMFTFDRIQN